MCLRVTQCIPCPFRPEAGSGCFLAIARFSCQLLPSRASDPKGPRMPPLANRSPLLAGSLLVLLAVPVAGAGPQPTAAPQRPPAAVLTALPVPLPGGGGGIGFDDLGFA